MSPSEPAPTVAGVALTNLDQPLFDGAGATKRDLVDYLDQMADRLIPHLRDRPLSVIRVRPGQAPFMQKNLPKYTPEWVASVTVWAESAKRDIRYALVATTAGPWCGSPTSGRSSTTRPWCCRTLGPADPPGARPGPAADRGRAAGFRAGRARRPAGAAGAGRRGTGRRGEDQRSQGGARLRAARPRPGWRTWPPPPGRSRPGPNGSIPTWRPRPSSARTGTARCSSTRPGPAARRWSPPTARGSGRACRCRSRWPGTSWTP